jgi:glutaredoxin-like protein
MVISEKDKKNIQTLFAKNLKEPVKLVLFTQKESKIVLPFVQPCQWCQETESLLKEVASLSDKLQVEIYDFVKDEAKVKEFKIDKIPAIVVMGKEDVGIRYFGIPAGYEFTSFVGDILDISRNQTELSPETKDKLGKIDKDIHIQVFVTPTCPYCPPAVRLAHQMAMVNPHIKADMVEASEFPALVQKYGVRGVPRTVINEGISFEGAVPENLFLEAVMKAAEAEA